MWQKSVSLIPGRVSVNGIGYLVNLELANAFYLDRNGSTLDSLTYLIVYSNLTAPTEVLANSVSSMLYEEDEHVRV